jgi:hypothetical protein
MMPEEEAPPERPARRPRPGLRREAAEAAPADRGASPADEPADVSADDEPPESTAPTTHGLLEELVGREIATRLRARHAEALARIHERDADAATRDAWVALAEALDPDTWLTPEAILEGVRDADRRFEELRAALVKADG